jgi:hypothetical protein
MTVTIQWDADAPLTAQPDAGSANKVYTVAGPGTVTITDEAIGGESRTLNFTVPLDLTTVVPTPASVDSAGNLAARTISVAGEGFPPSTNGTVAIATGAPGAYGVTLVAVGATTNSAGIFTGVSVVVPVDADAGAYHLESTFGDIADLDAALTITNTGLAAPTGLASPSQTATTVTLTWSAATDAEEYVVRWAPAGSGTWTERPAVAALTDTVTGLTASTSYDFQVKSQAEGMSDSPWSTTLTQATTALPTLSAPTSPAAGTPTTTEIPFSWDAVTNADTYTVEWRVNPAGAWTAITGIATTNTTVTGLDPNTTYDLRVKAVADGFTDSPYSTVVTETTDALGTLTAPTGIASPSQTATTINLTWTAVANAETYGIERSPAGAGTWVEVMSVATNSATVTGMTASTNYDFRIAARAEGWIASAWSATFTQATTA